VTTYVAGTTATLTVQWADYPGGPAADVTGQAITIKTAAGDVVVGATSTGIVRLATGSYSYSWAIPLGQDPGDYVAVWDATDAASAAVEASEIFTVAAPGTPLATPADLAAALGRPLTDAEAARAPALLASASARIRRYTGQTFSYVPDDTFVTRADRDQVRLPQRPVTAVTSVFAVGTGGLPNVPLLGWWWDGLDIVYLGGLGIQVNLPEWWLDECPDYSYRVLYSHGYQVIPADVVDVAVGAVLRTLTAPTQAGGVTSETIGSYSYRIDTAGLGVSVTLTKDDKDALADYRGNKTQGTVRMSAR
jgi:hypothetical protein